MSVLLDLVPTVITAVVPMDINITPNDNGLPGIAALRTIVGAVMTIALIPSALALLISAVVWGFRRQQRHLRLPREVGRPDLVCRGDHHRWRGDADQLLLARRRHDLLT